MSGDVVNLRNARKVKQRAAKESRAGENRALFGRTKEERRRDELEPLEPMRQAMFKAQLRFTAAAEASPQSPWQGLLC